MWESLYAIGCINCFECKYFNIDKLLVEKAWTIINNVQIKLT